MKTQFGKTKEKLNNIKQNIFDFLKNNKLFVLLFVLATTYFLIENISTISWDLSVYILNAKHLFAESTYFEVGRPPLASIIIGLFGLAVGWTLAEILFIIFTSTLFAYAIYKLSKLIKFNATIMYALSLNIYVLVNATSVGTELLSLSFLILAVIMIIKNNASSGIFLALTGLTRYTALAMFPLAIFHFNTKKIIKSIILFGLIITTWLTYNYFAFGNLFESIANQYALNVINRQHLVQPIQIQHFLETTNLLLPLMLAGIIITTRKFILEIYKKTIKNTKQKLKKLKQLKIILDKNKAYLIMLTILIYTIYSYATTPFKFSRYLFFMVLPTIYFSYIGLEKIIIYFKKIKTKNTTQNTKKSRNTQKTMLIIALIIFATNIALLILVPTYYESPDAFKHAKDQIENLNLSHCQIESNVWPQLNYVGITAAPYSRQSLLNERLNDGTILVMFKYAGEPEYANDKEYMQTLPIIHEDNQLYIIGQQNCTNKTAYTRSYLQEMKEYISKTHNYEPNINPCFILFKDYALLEKTCNFIHTKKFTQDKNRELW